MWLCLVDETGDRMSKVHAVWISVSLITAVLILGPGTQPAHAQAATQSGDFTLEVGQPRAIYVNHLSPHQAIPVTICPTAPRTHHVFVKLGTPAAPTVIGSTRVGCLSVSGALASERRSSSASTPRMEAVHNRPISTRSGCC
jgi:hypothetical protein